MNIANKIFQILWQLYQNHCYSSVYMAIHQYKISRHDNIKCEVRIQKEHGKMNLTFLDLAKMAANTKCHLVYTHWD